MRTTRRLLTSVAIGVLVALFTSSSAAFAFSPGTGAQVGSYGQALADTPVLGAELSIVIAPELFPLSVAELFGLLQNPPTQYINWQGAESCQEIIAGNQGYPNWSDPEFSGYNTSSAFTVDSGTQTVTFDTHDPWQSECDPVLIFPELYPDATAIAKAPWQGRFCATISTYSGNGYFPPSSPSSLPGSSWSWIDDSTSGNGSTLAFTGSPSQMWQVPRATDNTSLFNSDQSMLNWLNTACPVSWLQKVYGPSVPIVGTSAPPQQAPAGTTQYDADNYDGYCDLGQGPTVALDAQNQGGWYSVSCNVSSWVASTAWGTIATSGNWQMFEPTYEPLTGGGTTSTPQVNYCTQYTNGANDAGTYSLNRPGQSFTASFCLAFTPSGATFATALNFLVGEYAETAGGYNMAVLLGGTWVQHFFIRGIETIGNWPYTEPAPGMYFPGGSPGPGQTQPGVKESSPAATPQAAAAPATQTTVPAGLPTTTPTTLATPAGPTSPPNASTAAPIQVFDPTDFSWLGNLFTTLINGLTGAITWLAGQIWAGLQSLAGDIGRDFAWLSDALTPLLTDIWQGTLSIVNAVDGIAGAILNGLETLFIPDTATLQSQAAQLQTTWQSSPPGAALTSAENFWNTFYGIVHGALGASPCGPVISTADEQITFGAGGSYEIPSFTLRMPSPPPCPGNGPNGARTSFDDNASDLWGYRSLARGLQEFAIWWWFTWAIVGWTPWATKSATILAIYNDEPDEPTPVERSSAYYKGYSLGFSEGLGGR